MSADAPGLPIGMLARMVERAPVGMSVHDADGRCLVINEALAEINGVPASDCVGRTVRDYLPALAPRLGRLFEQVMATGAEVRAEVHGETPAAPGRPRWWAVTFRPIELGEATTGVAAVVEEITERKAAFDAVTASEHELREVFERIDQGFCVCEIVVDAGGDPVDYRFVDVNALFEEMTGLSDATGHTALELVPDLEPQWIEAYGRVALAGETIRFQQGSEAMGRWFDVFATPLATPGRFAIVFRDETARRTAEAVESELAQRYQAMADDLPLMVWLHGPDGRQEFVNNTYCDYFGVAREQMVRDNWHVLVHPDDVDRYTDGFERAVAERIEFHQQVRVRDGSGRWRWLESWGTPRFGPGGEFLGHLGASADVTERVNAETALVDAEQFLRRVLDSLSTFVGVLEPDGTVIEANRAPLEAAGLTIDDVRGKKFWDCFWWGYDDGISAELRHAVELAAAGEHVHYDVPIRVAGDERLWIDFQIAPLRGADGTITHLVPSALDITERIESARERSRLLVAEQERRRRAELLEEHAADLTGAADPVQVSTVTVEHLERHLDVASVAVINLLRSDGAIQLVGGPMLRSDLVGDRRSVADDMPGAVAIASNEVVRCNDRRELRTRFAHLADAVESYGLQSLVALPLRSADHTALGALVVGSADADAFHASTLSLVHGLAEQTGLALERSLLHEQVVTAHRREHEIAIRLQRALLPDRLVEHPAVSIAAHYHAAGEQLEVGGDWYDTFRWPSGHIGVMVGDVVGHDLEAAAAMGRLRAAVAAAAPTLDPDPAAVLDALQRVARGPDGTAFVTAVCAVVDPATGRLRVALAGHPPPLLVREGAADWLEAVPAPPLGSLDVALGEPLEVQLQPGDLVVLYTDGVVERRGEPIDDGLRRLREHCAQWNDAELSALVEELTSAAADDDNVALALRWRPSDGPVDG